MNDTNTPTRTDVKLADQLLEMAGWDVKKCGDWAQKYAEIIRAHVASETAAHKQDVLLYAREVQELADLIMGCESTPAPFRMVKAQLEQRLAESLAKDALIARMREALETSRGNVSSLNDRHPNIWGEWLKVLESALAATPESAAAKTSDAQWECLVRDIAGNPRAFAILERYTPALAERIDKAMQGGAK